MCDYTYYVPTTLLVVFSGVLFELNIFANPKSEILGFSSLSKRMLLGLRSRCMCANASAYAGREVLLLFLQLLLDVCSNPVNVFYLHLHIN